MKFLEEKTEENSFNIHVIDVDYVDDFTADAFEAAAPQRSKNMHSFSARLSRISSSVTPKWGLKTGVE